MFSNAFMLLNHSSLTMQRLTRHNCSSAVHLYKLMLSSAHNIADIATCGQHLQIAFD